MTKPHRTVHAAKQYLHNENTAQPAVFLTTVVLIQRLVLPKWQLSFAEELPFADFSGSFQTREQVGIARVAQRSGTHRRLALSLVGIGLTHKANDIRWPREPTATLPGVHNPRGSADAVCLPTSAFSVTKCSHGACRQFRSRTVARELEPE